MQDKISEFKHQIDFNNIITAKVLLQQIFNAEIDYSDDKQNTLRYLFANKIIGDSEFKEELKLFVNNPKLLDETLTYLFSPGKEIIPNIRQSVKTINEALQIKKRPSYLESIPRELLSRASIFCNPNPSFSEPRFNQEERANIAEHEWESFTH